MDTLAHCNRLQGQLASTYSLTYTTRFRTPARKTAAINPLPSTLYQDDLMLTLHNQTDMVPCSTQNTCRWKQYRAKRIQPKSSNSWNQCSLFFDALHSLLRWIDTMFDGLILCCAHACGKRQSQISTRSQADTVKHQTRHQSTKSVACHHTRQRFFVQAMCKLRKLCWLEPWISLDKSQRFTPNSSFIKCLSPTSSPREYALLIHK